MSPFHGGRARQSNTYGKGEASLSAVRRPVGYCFAFWITSKSRPI